MTSRRDLREGDAEDETQRMRDWLDRMKKMKRKREWC